jgi:transposase-like protein
MDANTPARRTADRHRQCPICFHGTMNGVGEAYATRAPKTYYKCDRCGHTWTAEIKRVVSVEHREVELTTRDAPTAGEAGVGEADQKGRGGKSKK